MATLHMREQIKSMTCMTVISLIIPPPSLSLCVRGEKPSAILFLSCHGAVTDPMVLFYHSGICLSIASGDFTVCLFGCAFLKVEGSASFRMGMCRPQTDKGVSPHAALLDSV